MSFIGESRKGNLSPWSSYVCLDKDDCKMILGSIRHMCRRKEQAAERLIDIHEGGEATSRIDTEMDKAIDRRESAMKILCDIENYIKL